MDPRTDDSCADHLIALRAAQQHGVVTRAQLRSDGVSDTQIKLRLKRRLLLRLSTGVYAVGHRDLPRHGRAPAACLSAGPRAVLFDVAAASLLGVRESNSARWDIARPQASAWKGQPGIRPHANSTFLPEDITAVDGVPVTTVARTVVDLAARHPPRTVEKVLGEMIARDLYDQRALDAVLARPYLRGAKQLEHILGRQQAGTTVAKSELEELLLALCDAYGIARRETSSSSPDTHCCGSRGGS